MHRVVLAWVALPSKQKTRELAAACYVQSGNFASKTDHMSMQLGKHNRHSLVLGADRYLDHDRQEGEVDPLQH